MINFIIAKTMVVFTMILFAESLRDIVSFIIDILSSNCSVFSFENLR